MEIYDEDRLRRLAEHYATKYGWRSTMGDGAFLNDEGGRARVYVVVPQTAHGFDEGETFSQTRYRFDP